MAKLLVLALWLAVIPLSCMEESRIDVQFPVVVGGGGGGDKRKFAEHCASLPPSIPKQDHKKFSPCKYGGVDEPTEQRS